MSIDRLMNKEDMVHLYNRKPFSATCMQLEIIMLREAVRNRKTNTIWCHLYVKSRIWHKWTYLENRSRITDIGNRLVGGVWGREMEWEIWVSSYKILPIEWINNKVLLYSTGNYIQYPVINHDGEEYEKEYIIYIYIYICITESLCYTVVINTTL